MSFCNLRVPSGSIILGSSPTNMKQTFLIIHLISNHKYFIILFLLISIPVYFSLKRFKFSLNLANKNI